MCVKNLEVLYRPESTDWDWEKGTIMKYYMPGEFPTSGGLDFNKEQWVI